jgi:DegV family protein with EDD domain
MVKIVTDTTSGLPPEIAKRYDIPVIPQIVIFGSESFVEGVDIDNAGFMARLRASRELPKTAAPAPEAFVEVFQRLVPSGEPIICIHPSAELSGTIRAVTVAAAEFPNADIRIIDTRMVASPVATMVTLAAQWAEAGADADTIEARVRDMSARCRIYFVVPTLEYLAKGGRIGGATALLGGILQVKPILVIRDGRADVYDRERTQKRAVARLKALALEQISRKGDGYLSVMHGEVPDEAQAVADDLKAQLGLSDVPILDVPPAIVVHAGPGVLGVGFFVAG